jgi:predicted RNA-binding protein Jag
VIKSNTMPQMENFLRSVFEIADEQELQDEAALREAEAGVDEVLERGAPVELSPQNSHLRRLQHQLAERYRLASRSKGREPFRRVIIYPQ